ncbi:hypothetical protein POM88_009038 [Heracleum sosnowskyi]|uniref:Uncharacterized protein n=1 Tax=Heracleum sosnowskyi TaxID=360622 RepID=A0AAD8JAY4_9APIA|nr:hypothetical protein POM88_009038 [Heracleum sosnowskyi]
MGGTLDPRARAPDQGTREPGTQEHSLRDQRPGTRAPDQGTQEPVAQEPWTKEPGTKEPGTWAPDQGTRVPVAQEPGTKGLDMGAQAPMAQGTQALDINIDLEPGEISPRPFYEMEIFTANMAMVLIAASNRERSDTDEHLPLSIGNSFEPLCQEQDHVNLPPKVPAKQTNEDGFTPVGRKKSLSQWRTGALDSGYAGV